MRMNKSDGTFATIDAENMEILLPHFKQVFNNIRGFDKTVLHRSWERRRDKNLRNPPTFDEFYTALTWMNNKEAKGTNGIAVEGLKDLNLYALEQLGVFIVDFWTSGDTDIL